MPFYRQSRGRSGAGAMRCMGRARDRQGEGKRRAARVRCGQDAREAVRGAGLAWLTRGRHGVQHEAGTTGARERRRGASTTRHGASLDENSVRD